MNILFLCTGNSARSILAESLFNHRAGGRGRAFSAGSQPKGRVHPMALAVLSAHGISCDGAASKSWDVFAAPEAPQMDLVVTVCDNAAGETCPIWPGRPKRLHWSLPDPASVEDSAEAQRQAFEATFADLQLRLEPVLARVA